ncbi:MAG: AsmA family protein [Alphaproteobacteria bacterium]|nr:AsmA family protein [Alphaproteobacteria bacterium]
MADEGKPNSGKAVRRIGAVIAAVIFIPIIVIGILIATFDANKFRGEIAEVLSGQLGRTVTLNGNMSLSFSSGGAVLVIDNVEVANPDWASRPIMAKIGHLELAVALAPLLSHNLQIDRFTLSAADVELETSKTGKGNWEFKPKKTAAASETDAEDDGGEQSVRLSVDKAKVHDTRLAFRDGKTGKVTEVKLANLELAIGDETQIDAAGAFGEQDFKVSLAGGAFDDLIADKEWAFEGRAAFAGNTVEGSGKLRQKGKIVDLSPVTLGTPMGKLAGALNINSTGARPKIKGELSSEKLVAATKTEGVIAGAVEGVVNAAVPKRMFSEDKIDLTGLRAADANIELSIDAFETPAATIEHIVTVVSLDNGKLSMMPVGFSLAGNPLRARVSVNAAPDVPQVSMILQGEKIDSNSLLALWDLDKVVVGPTNIDIDVNGAGDSLHAIAASLDGQASLEVGKGEIPASGMKEMAGGLMNILLPGAEGVTDASLTCISSKFTIKNGIATAKGLLADTNLVTIAGAGGVNLGEETIDMLLKPLPKQKTLLDAAVPLRVTGKLNKPGFNLDASGVAQTAASRLLGVQLPQSGLKVPVVDSSKVTAGNPCTLALANPVYAEQEQKPGVLTPKIEEAKQAIEDKTKGVVDMLGKDLGAKLFGN